jgi:hypothetical protein
MTLDRDAELRAALAQLRSEPPERAFDARLRDRLAYEVSLRALREAPPASDFEQRLHERLATESEGPRLRLVATDASLQPTPGEVGLTPGTPDQGAVAPLPAATPSRRTRKRGAWLAAAIVLLAGGATASAQSGLFVDFAARVEHVVKAWTSSRATAEREREAPPARPERLVPRPSAMAQRPAVAEPPRVSEPPRELARPEPAELAPPPAPPVERLELSTAKRALDGEAAGRRAAVERMRRDLASAARERRERAGMAERSAPSRVAAGAAERRGEGPRRAQVERVRIEPEALRRAAPARERVRASDVMRDLARERQERQSRERREPIVVVREQGTRRSPPPAPPPKERAPHDLSRGERPRR